MTRRYTLAENYRDQGCALVEVPVALAPYIAGQLRRLERRYLWASDGDYERAYNALLEVKRCLVGSCLSDLVASQERLYRLLDTALNGTAYTATPNPADPANPTITPAIPVVPPDPSPAALPTFALRSRLERLVNLVDNLSTGQQFPLDPAFLSDSALQNNTGLRETITNLQGVINAGWFGIGGKNAQISDIVEALRIGSDGDKTIIDQAIQALQVADNASDIFNTVRSLLTETVDAGLEGAALGTLIASTIAAAAAQSVLVSKLDRIISTLDGGALLGPDNNVLDTLESIDASLQP